MKFFAPNDGEATGTLAARNVRDALAPIVAGGVLWIDPNGRLLFASAEARRALGAASDEAMDACWAKLGRALLDSSGPDSARDEAVEVEWAVGPDARRVVFQVHRLGGSKCDGFVAIVRDGAGLERLEADAALAVHMLTLDTVAHAVVHDLRTPLNTMVFNVELLRQSLDKKPEPDVREAQQRYLKGLRDEIRRLNDLLNAFAAQVVLPDAGTGEFDLQQVVAEIAAVLEAQAKRRRTTFGVRLGDRHVRVLGARGRVQHAVLEIGLRALESTPAGEAFEMEVDDRDRRARVIFRHGGPALSFEGPNRTSTRGGDADASGAWISLVIARSFVESLDGQVEVDSEPGRGTAVRLTFPLATKRN